MAYNLEALRVLLVDDDRFMRSLIKSLLYTMELREICEADNGESAWAKFQEADCDLVLTDYVMQPVNGIDLVRRMRADPESRNRFVPIIMISGFAEKHRVIEARDAGITEYLAKPLSIQRLYRRIASIIEQPRVFIDAPIFKGPDRRRFLDDSSYDGPDRRCAGEQEDGDLSREQIAALHDQRQSIEALERPIAAS